MTTTVASLAAHFAEKGGLLIDPADCRYPLAISERTGRPALHVLGDADALAQQGIGLCGSRSASPAGITLAQRLGALAAEIGVTLVSGYAKGVDTAGHLAVLEAGGKTIAVLAEGISKFRLRRDYSSLFDPLEQMTVVSQFPFDARWAVYRAMERNKVICALSQLMVAIEPGEQGGTLNAAQESIRQSKPLIVVWPEYGEIPGHVRRLVERGGILTRNESEATAAVVSLQTNSLPIEPSMFTE